MRGVLRPELRAAAVAGLGATVLPRYLRSEHLERGRLVDVFPNDDPPINTLYLATRATIRDLPHIAHAWAALLTQGRLW